MAVVIPDEILRAAALTPEELLQELAVLLFQQDRLTLGQASELAGLDRLAFQQVLGRRHIPIHYDVEELHEDVATLRRLGRLP
jgi:predicted HTH domain antitoxin